MNLLYWCNVFLIITLYNDIKLKKGRTEGMNIIRQATRHFVSRLQKKKHECETVKHMSYEEVIRRYEELCTR